MRELFQTAMGALGSVGFAVLFNIRGTKLAWAGAGGALGWSVYLAVRPHGVFAALFAATAAVSLAGEVLARVLRTPVLILTVPMLIPLIPGSDLYAMMSALVRAQYETFGLRAQFVTAEAGAIALGILCTASAADLVRGLRRRTAIQGEKPTWRH